MASRGLVRFGDATIEYEVRRSERRKKTVQITVDGGGVQVAAPIKTPDTELEAIVRKRAAWILNHAREGVLRPARKRFVSGETLPYLGRNVKPNCRVLRTCARSGRSASTIGASGLPIPGRLGRRRALYRLIHRALVDWYRATEPPSGYGPEIQRWWPRLGNGGEAQILIRDQRQRWGSCAPDGTLRFNWRVMMLEASLVEYIIVHELVHLSIKNHSANFWRALAGVLPDVEQRRQRLREAGKSLPL